MGETDKVGLFFDEAMAKHRNLEDSSHPEQPARILRIFERLQEEGHAGRCHRIPCRPALRAELALKHTQEHIDAMLAIEGKSEKQAILASRNYNSVYLCPDSTQAALLSAGSVLEATKQVCKGKVRSAVCVVRPPGHHAECGCAMGFCMFGNVALAAAKAREEGWASRVLIVDWDVHHGNGTQNMFEEDPTVLYFSTHRYDNGRFYPGGKLGHFESHGAGPGAGFSVNVPWDVVGGQRRGCTAPGDAEMVDAWERVLMPVARAFKPDLVLISAGFDAAEGDPLGGCKITPAGYHELTRQLTELASGRVVIALEGGYNLESISASMAACTGALLGDPPPNTIGSAQSFHADTVSSVCSHLQQFWPALKGGVAPRAPPALDPNTVPPEALTGGMMEMHLALRAYAEASGGSYHELRKKQEALLFKLADQPAEKRPVGGARRQDALKQSFGRQAEDGKPYLVAIIEDASPELAVQKARVAFDAGVDGLWLVGKNQGEREAHARELRDSLSAVRELFPDRWLGICAPWLQASEVFGWVADNCPSADAVWLQTVPCRVADIEWETLGFGRLAQRKAVRVNRWLTASDTGMMQVDRARKRASWLGLAFGTIASQADEKVHHHQDSEDWQESEPCTTLLARLAQQAATVCDVVVTTGQPGSTSLTQKLLAMSRAKPLALVVNDTAPSSVVATSLVFAASALCNDGGAGGFDPQKVRSWVGQWTSQ